MKFRFYLIFALAGLLLSSCAVEELHTEGGFIIAEMETDQTRTAVTDEGAFTWSSGDQVWLHTTAEGVVGTLSSGAGTSSAKFAYGGFVGEMTGKAVYPYNDGHSISGEVLNFVLPASYDLGSSLNNTNAAMYGVNVGGTIKFNHLAGVMRFKLKDVPAGVNKFTITLDKKINGTFSADLTADYPVIETSAASAASEKTITLNFNALTEKSDISLYVPLPIGSYNSLELGIYDDDQEVWTYSKAVTNTVGWKSLKLMPVVTIGGEINGDIVGEGDGEPNIDDEGLNVNHLINILKELEDNSEVIKQYLVTLETDMTNYQAIRDDKNEEADCYEALAAQAERQFQNYRTEMKVALAELSSSFLAAFDEVYTALQYEKNELYYCNAALDSHKDKIAFYKEKYLDNIDKILELEAQAEILSQNILKLAQIIDQLGIRLIELEQRVSALCSTTLYGDTSKTRPQKTKQNVMNSGENSSFSADIQALENNLLSLSHNMESLASYLGKIETRILEMEDIIESVEGNIPSLKAECDRLKAEMESAMAKAEELNQKVKEMDKELETLRSRYLDGEQIYDQLNQKILTYKIDILYLQYYIDNSSKTEEESLMIKQMYDEIKADMETLLGDIKEFIVSLG
jgi:chromosome segregation ATPase